jgi:hypothetical protein
MDKRLLDALTNLSWALEEIADVLKSGKNAKKSATSEALVSGDFAKDMKSIVVGIQSVKKDTQEILRQQKTIMSMSKRNNADDSSFFERAGGDKKSESSLKKGVGTILLIAVAVLAIGMAFKIIGKVDFLSVIALSIAILIISKAFTDVGLSLGQMSLGQIFRTSLFLVAMALAVTVSSFILSKIVRISLLQIVTGVLIVGMFAAMSNSIGPILDAVKYRINPLRLFITLVALSAAITASSWILSLIKPMSLMQSITAIMIGAMFSVMARSLEPIFDAVSSPGARRLKPMRLFMTLIAISGAIAASSHILALVVPLSFAQILTTGLIGLMFAMMIPRMTPLFDALSGPKVSFLFSSRMNSRALFMTLVAISAAITASSWLLTLVTPISLMQALTAIGIAFMFAVMSYHFERLAIGITIFDTLKVSMKDLVFTLLGISLAITVSSWILKMVTPLSIGQYLTALGIAVLFAMMSFVMPFLAVGIVLMDKMIGARKMLLVVPLIFTALSLAIMISSHILSMSADMEFSFIMKLIFFGVGLGLIVLAMLPSVLAVGIAVASGVGAVAIGLGVAAIPVIALAVMLSSHILSAGNYENYPGIGWALGVGASMLGFGLAILELGTFITATGGLGAIAILAGALAVPVVAASIVAADSIIREGKYDNYPGLGWIASVGVTMTGFGLAIITLGSYIVGTLGLGGIAIWAGAKAVTTVAQAILDTDSIIGQGKYDNYPGIGWIASVGTTMTGFGLAIITLGGYIVGSLGLGGIAIWAGAKAVTTVAQAIVDTDSIIREGKYDNYPGAGWIASVGITMTGFGMAIITLGGYILGSLGLGGIAIWAGAKAVTTVAQAIVDTDAIISKGKYKNYPGAGWIASVGITMTGFGLAIITLGGYIVGSLGLGGIAIWAGAKAVTTVAQAIVDTDRIISKGKYENYPGAGWIASVGVTMTGFGLAIITLGSYILGSLGLGGVAIWAGKKAVSSVAQAIVDTDRIISKGKYENYPGWEWALSVGGLMTAFGTAVLTLGSFVVGTLGLGGVALWAGKKAVTVIAQSIVDAAWIFKGAEGAFQGGPKKEWAEGISLALGAFSPIYGMLLKGSVIKALLGSSVSSEDYSTAIRTISQGIVDAAWFFQGAKAAFVGGPKKEWAEGVGKAIGAFAPVFKIVADTVPGWFTSGGPSVETYKSAIRVISEGIIESAGIFAGSKVGFDKGTYPSKEWASGVGAAINAFAPVFNTLSKDTGWFTSGEEVISNIYNGITRVTDAIVEVGRKFSNNADINWGIYPDSKWGAAVSSSVKSFMGAYGSVSSTDFDESEYNIVLKAARYMTQVAKRLFTHKKYFEFEINFDKTPIESYLDIYKTTKSRYDVGKKDPLISLATSMTKFAKILYVHRNVFSYKINPDFMESMRSNVNSFIRIHKSVDSYYTVARIMKFKMFDPLQMAIKDIRKVIRGMNIKMPTNTIDSSFMKKTYAVVSSFHKVHKFAASNFGLGYLLRRGIVVKVLADIANVTKQIGKIPIKKIPSDLLNGVLTNLKNYYINYQYAKSKTTLFEIGGNPLKRALSGIKLIVDGFSTIKPVSRGFVKNFLPDAFKSIKVYGDIVEYSYTKFSTLTKTFSMKRVISGIKDLVSAFSGPGLKMNIGKYMMRDMYKNVSNYLRIVDMIGKDKYISSMMKGIKTNDPIAKMASGITILANALDKISKSMSKFNKTMMSIDETKIKSFGDITKNLFSGTNTDDLLKSMTGLMTMMSGSDSYNNKVKKSQGGNQRQDVVTNKLLPLKGKMAITSGKHGNPLQQMDKLIDVLLAFKLDVKRIETMMRHKNSDFSSNI